MYVRADLLGRWPAEDPPPLGPDPLEDEVSGLGPTGGKPAVGGALSGVVGGGLLGPAPADGPPRITCRGVFEDGGDGGASVLGRGVPHTGQRSSVDDNGVEQPEQ